MSGGDGSRTFYSVLAVPELEDSSLRPFMEPSGNAAAVLWANGERSTCDSEAYRLFADESPSLILSTGNVLMVTIRK